LDIGPARVLLREAGLEVLDRTDHPQEEQLARVVALLVGYEQVGADLLDRLPALRIVATHSVGVDMVDVGAVRARGLWLANLPEAATEEVAVHALSMALALVRRLPAYDRDVRESRWLNPAAPLPRVPGDLTMGIVGMGRIGQALARMSQALFGHTVGYDPHLPDPLWPVGTERVPSVADLFARCDCVSLHLPLSAETHHLVDAELLGLMPDRALLINTARGGLVDETALLTALDERRLEGAACDVLSSEPPMPDHPLLHDSRVLLSPHVAYLSTGSLRRYAELPARNVVALLTDGAPLSSVVTPG
jgi:D-3-phosphoglycerate dehydrogenase